MNNCQTRITDGILKNRISALSNFVGCENTTVIKVTVSATADGFDNGLFSAFFLTLFSIASEKSADRSAMTEILTVDGNITFRVGFNIMEVRKCKSAAADRKCADYGDIAVRHFDAVFKRLNLLFDTENGKDYSALFSPVRNDVSLLSLKTRNKLR